MGAVNAPSRGGSLVLPFVPWSSDFESVSSFPLNCFDSGLFFERSLDQSGLLWRAEVWDGVTNDDTCKGSCAVVTIMATPTRKGHVVEVLVFLGFLVVIINEGPILSSKE